MAVAESLDLLLHLPLLLLCVGDLEQRLHLGEQPPPLPVAQLQVALHVTLDDADGAELLYALLVGPGGGEEGGGGEEVEGRRGKGRGREGGGGGWEGKNVGRKR